MVTHLYGKSLSLRESMDGRCAPMLVVYDSCEAFVLLCPCSLPPVKSHKGHKGHSPL